MIEDLKSGNLSYTIVGKFLSDLKKEFDRENNKMMKMAELKKIEQEVKIIEEFVQKFKRVAKSSGYKRRPLIEEFKQEMNKVIKKKLIEAKIFLRSIEQWYKRVTNLGRYQKESRIKKKRLRERGKTETSIPRQNIVTNITGTQRQQLPQSQIWPRKQRIQQQVPVGPTIIEEIEKTNAVIVKPN